MNECRWLDIINWTKYHSLLQIWKTVYWKIPEYMDENLIRLENNKLDTTAPRLLLTRISYRCKTVETWNELPENLRSEDKLSNFKKGIKIWLSTQMTRRTNLDASLPLYNRPPDINH